MNIDRLIDRIEKALREGATDPVLHSLAKEYAKFRTKIDERLDHCVTLIRSGKDFAARELAEQPPDVLVLMEKLSFANDAKWKTACEEKGLYLGPNWSEDHVDLLNGLYDKEITEDSPLFREYRTAARSRDDDRTFKILKMILKASPDHASAKRHFGQLSVKILEKKIEETDTLIAAGREQEFLDLMMEVEETSWVVQPKGEKWENALAVRHNLNRRNAKLRLEQILVELATFKSSDDWKGSLALIGEYFELAQEFELEGEIDPDDVNVYNEYKDWAEELADEARAERELENLVGRFKNRLAEMRQAEAAGSKNLEIYLEEQNELRRFRQDFQDIGHSVATDVLMDLQKAETHVKNRIGRLQGRTKRLWFAAVFSFVLLSAGAVTLIWWLNGFWQARSAAEAIVNTDGPALQWEKLSAYTVDYGDFLEDAEVQIHLRQAVDKAFGDAKNNLITHERGVFRGKSQDNFLLVTQNKKVSFLEAADVRRRRYEVVAKMCENVLEDLLNDPGFDAKDAERFMDLFQDEPVVRKDENGKDLPLEEVDYFTFQDQLVKSELLLDVSRAVAESQEGVEDERNRFRKMYEDIIAFDKRLLQAVKDFRDSGKVNHGILAQEEYIDKLDAATKEFSNSKSVGTTNYGKVRDAMRRLRSTWRAYSREVENNQGSKVDELLDQADQIGKAVQAGNVPNARDQLGRMSELLKSVSAMNKGTTDQLKLSSSQTRRLAQLMEVHADALGRLGEAGAAKSGLGKAAGLEEYFANLDQVLRAKAYDPSTLNLVREVSTRRVLFDNDKGQLQTKLVFNGPKEVWEKIKEGKIRMQPEESRKEFDALSASIAEGNMRDVWYYKLYECQPVPVTAGTGGPRKYTTNKTLVTMLTSIGQVQEERIPKKFDEQGKPIPNPSVQVIQQGNFLLNGAPQGRLFESLEFNGGLKGHVAQEGQLTPESHFVQFQLERRLDKNTRSIDGTLLDLLELILRQNNLSPLFKGFFHAQICELILKRPEEWGAVLSKNLAQDYQDLKQKTGARLKPGDWMNRRNFEAVEGALAIFYQGLRNRSYSGEAKLNSGILKALSSVGFRYAGHVDASGKPKFEGPPPPFVWGLGRPGGGGFALQRMAPNNAVSGSTGSQVEPFSPLLTVDRDLSQLYNQAYATAGVAPGTYGTLDELLPFKFGN